MWVCQGWQWVCQWAWQVGVSCGCVNFNQFKSVKNSLKFMEDEQEPSSQHGRGIKGGRWVCHVGVSILKKFKNPFKIQNS